MFCGSESGVLCTHRQSCLSLCFIADVPIVTDWLMTYLLFTHHINYLNTVLWVFFLHLIVFFLRGQISITQLTLRSLLSHDLLSLDIARLSVRYVWLSRYLDFTVHNNQRNFSWKLFFWNLLNASFFFVVTLRLWNWIVKSRRRRRQTAQKLCVVVPTCGAYETF